jgi:hypothetical protein
VRRGPTMPLSEEKMRAAAKLLALGLFENYLILG